ncbi:MAG: hypothetical protein PHQ46_12075 [Negativicutes bacterium]|nr:hypothetical protein [Negativicutes bacterium]
MLNLITVDDLHDIVNALSVALDAKSSYTGGHSERVAEISLLLAKHLGLSMSQFDPHVVDALLVLVEKQELLVNDFQNEYAVS